MLFLEESSLSNQDETQAPERLPISPLLSTRPTTMTVLDIRPKKRLPRTASHSMYSSIKSRYRCHKGKMQRRNAVNFLATEETSEVLSSYLFRVQI